VTIGTPHFGRVIRPQPGRSLDIGEKEHPQAHNATVTGRDETAVAIIAYLAYKAQTRVKGIGRWTGPALPVVPRFTPGYRRAVPGINQ
jgi:hypothetical protein